MDTPENINEDASLQKMFYSNATFREIKSYLNTLILANPNGPEHLRTDPQLLDADLIHYGIYRDDLAVAILFANEGPIGIFRRRNMVNVLCPNSHGYKVHIELPTQDAAKIVRYWYLSKEFQIGEEFSSAQKRSILLEKIRQYRLELQGNKNSSRLFIYSQGLEKELRRDDSIIDVLDQSLDILSMLKNIIEKEGFTYMQLRNILEMQKQCGGKEIDGISIDSLITYLDIIIKEEERE